MGARQKLNTAYATGALVIAALIGTLAQSWTFFLLAAAALLACALYDGGIRPRSRK